MARKMRAAIVSDRLPIREWDMGDWVQFQRPDRFTDEQLARVQASAEVVYDGNLRFLRNRPSISEQESEMVANCLVGCSVMYGEGHPKANTPVFVPGVNCRQAMQSLNAEIKTAFYTTWYGLDPELAEAIVAELRDWHPPFNLWQAPPPKSRESDSSSNPSSETISKSSKSGASSTTNGTESTDSPDSPHQDDQE